MSVSIANIDNAVDSIDVTLALSDTGSNPEHKMVLAAANPPLAMTKLNADLDSTSSLEVLKPSSTPIIPDSPAATVGSIILDHQLNPDNIQQKLINNVSLPMIETKTNKNDTLLNGVNHLDKAGSKERSIIRLSSEFGQITATFFNTTHKIAIQGNKQAVDLFDAALVPFINKQLVEKSKEINYVNDNMLVLTPFTTSDTYTAA